MINCNLDRNRNNPTCRKERVGEASFSVILPKRDNSGMKINNSLYQKYISKMNRRFGGTSTYPSVLGCFRNKKTKKTECETNFEIKSLRDFENPFNDKSGLTPRERKGLLRRDYGFMKRLAKDAGDEFGQTAMLIIRDDINDASLIFTKRKKRLPSKKIFDDFFNREI